MTMEFTKAEHVLTYLGVPTGTTLQALYETEASTNSLVDTFNDGYTAYFAFLENRTFDDPGLTRAWRDGYESAMTEGEDW